ncbi:DMT family transporter [Desulfocurvus sp. DL9XJH121]
MDALFILLAVAAGATAPVQAGINAQLQASWARTPVLASLVSFFVGTVALACYVLATREPLPGLSGMGQAPWWQWTGGLLGAFFVTMTILLAYRLGGATLFSLVVAGQLAASLVLEHYGLLGYAAHPVNWQRLAGAALVVAGVVLVRRF